jgi:hypothetical protein
VSPEIVTSGSTARRCNTHPSRAAKVISRIAPRIREARRLDGHHVTERGIV